MKFRLSGNVFISAAITLLSFSFITYTACIKDHCGSNLCANSGLCVDGNCACVTGYEGAHCDTIWSAKFSGTWKVAETTQDSDGVYNANYILTVQQSSIAQNFLMYHVENAYDSIYCVLSSINTFNIPGQSNADSTFYVQGGNGTLDLVNGTVSVNYSFVEDRVQKNASMQWTR
jgi:hypothetical protein